MIRSWRYRANGAAEPQREKVIQFALEERFDHIQIAGEHGFGKPEERAYTHALEVLGVGPRETWMVGDNLECEISAPQRLGIYGVWYDGYATELARPDHPLFAGTPLVIIARGASRKR